MHTKRAAQVSFCKFSSHIIARNAPEYAETSLVNPNIYDIHRQKIRNLHFKRYWRQPIRYTFDICNGIGRAKRRMNLQLIGTKSNLQILTKFFALQVNDIAPPPCVGDNFTDDRIFFLFRIIKY